MYNYYIAEKKKKLDEEKKLIEKKEFIYKEKRKKTLDDLYVKYENRVRNFIMDMVHKPIKVKDYIHPINSTREELFQEEEGKIQGRKGFIFKGYKTERERIDDLIQNSNYLITNTTDDNLNTSLNDSSSNILQPQMRYKPRTDLERIFDEINKNSFGRVNKDIIDKQLRDLDLNFAKIKKTSNINEEDLSFDYLNPESTNRRKFKKTEIKETEKTLTTQTKSKPSHKIKKKEINTEAKHLMSDLHNKTHFKGAIVIANHLNPAKKQNPRNNKLNGDENVTPPFNVKSLFTGLNQKENLNNSYNSVRKKERNNTEYLRNFNPYINQTIATESFDKDSFRRVKNMAFFEKGKNNDEGSSDFKRQLKFLSMLSKGKKLNNKSMLKYNPVSFFKILTGSIHTENDDFGKKDEDKVIIDNEPIPRNRVDLIANKILHTCNVNHAKNKNNNKTLKNGNGKLMITKGMSLAEFEEKFRFK